MSNFSNFNGGVPLPLTYPDLVCNPDVDPLGAETTSDLQNLIQDVMHVRQEDLGSNLDDPNRGCGIRDYLSGASPNLQTLAGNIQSQLHDDPRLSSVTAQVVVNYPGSQYPYTILVNLGVDGNVIGVSYGWSNQTGLIYQTP
jgi:hypothetical protein